MFDQQLRIQRRDRAARRGFVDFLHVRALEDMLDRLDAVRRDFDRVLVLGCPSPTLAAALRDRFPHAHFRDPSPLLAAQLEGTHGSDILLDIEPGRLDLLLSLGTLAETNDPLETLLRFRFALAPGGLCLGALVGGDSLPLLRASMHEVAAASGQATPFIHPRLDPASLSQLLTQAGFSQPVVDVDRVAVRYRDLARLVEDLRGMAATNFLTDRSRRSLSRPALRIAQERFAKYRSSDGKVAEIFHLIHFAAWHDLPPNG